MKPIAHLVQAEIELEEEQFREDVDKAKIVLKEKRKSLWSRLLRTIKTKKIVIKLEDK